jgi:hypothetical protein
LAQLVHNYLDKLDGLREEVIQNADNILDAIDMDDLLNDPEGYLLALGDAFLKEHIDEIQEADKEGKKFAEKVLKKS